MRNLKTSLMMALAIGVLVFAGATTASADPLGINSTIPNPTNIVFPPGSTFLASTSQNVNGMNALGQVTFTGTMRAAVYRSAGGTLDFYYQYTATAGPSNPNRLSFFDYNGFSTDVFEIQAGFAAGAVNFLAGGVEAVVGCDRGTGDLGCNYGPGALTPGTTTFTVLIRTNATEFTAGTFNVIDGGVATIVAYQPTNIPEPASMLLLGTGLVGLAGAARRKLQSNRK